MIGKKKTAAILAAAAAGLGIFGNAVLNDGEEDISREITGIREQTAVQLTDETKEKTSWDDSFITAENDPESIKTDVSLPEPEPESESASESDPEEIPEISPSVQTDMETVHADSTMTAERIAELTGVAVFWAPTGEKIHINPECRTFGRGFTFAGTLEQAQTVRAKGWCGICSKNAPDYTYAVEEYLAACYTYEDFCAGIPADAFK